METAKAINKLSCNVAVFGEIEIGNTTASVILIAILMGKNQSNFCGSRASSSYDGVNHAIATNKIAIFKEAIKYHSASKMKGRPWRWLVVAKLQGWLVQC